MRTMQNNRPKRPKRPDNLTTQTTLYFGHSIQMEIFPTVREVDGKSLTDRGGCSHILNSKQTWSAKTK